MRSLTRFLHPTMENKAFRNISSAEFRKGVYAVPYDRISPQGIRDEGPVDERDDKRVVGKGWRMVDGNKIEVLLFEDGTWGNSENYAKVAKKKSQRVSRPPSTISPHGTRHATTLAFTASSTAPTNNDEAINRDKTDGSRHGGKADIAVEEIDGANKTTGPRNSLEACLAELNRSSQDSNTTVRKPIIRSDTAVKSLNLDSDTSSGYNGSNEEESEASRTKSSSLVRPNKVLRTDSDMKQSNAEVNSAPPADVPNQRGGAGISHDWVSKVKKAVRRSKEPFDPNLRVYDEAEQTSEQLPHIIEETEVDNVHEGTASIAKDDWKNDAISSRRAWPSLDEAGSPRNHPKEKQQAQPSTSQSIEHKSQIELWKNLPDGPASFSTAVVFRQMQQAESMRLGLGAGGRSDQQIVLNAVRERIFREQNNGMIDAKFASRLIAYAQLKLGQRRTSMPDEEPEWDMLEDNDAKSTAAKNGGKLFLYDVNYDHRQGRGRYLSRKKSS